MASVQGTCDPQFSEVKTLFEQFIASGEELGASVTVNIGGKNVVDIWGGFKDTERTQPWESDTIANVFSMTKLIVAFSVLLLVDRGLLSLDDKVAKHWPEFAQNGKQDIRVRHILSHTSGVAGWDQQLSLEDICDNDKMTSLLEKQAPWWEPGTQSGYHSFSFGYLLGELIRRVSGKSLGRFVAEDVAGPLGADFYIGVRPGEVDVTRVSDVVPPPVAPPLSGPGMGADSVGYRVFINPPMQAAFANSDAFRRAELGAGNGHTNARGTADILSVVSLRGVTPKGERFMSAATVDEIFQEQVRNVDLVVPVGGDRPLRWGVGAALTGPGTAVDWLPFYDDAVGGGVCTWGGFGGSIAVMDTKRGMTITYVMNRMENVGLGSDRTRAYIAAAYRAVGWSYQP